MNGRCKTCKWWGDDYPESEDYGRCALAESDDGLPIHKESLALAEDGESYSAWLTTHATFGCVQWEQGDHE